MAVIGAERLDFLDDAWAVTFTNSDLGLSTIGLMNFEFLQFGRDPRNIVAIDTLPSLTASTVPLPGTLVMFLAAIGLGGGALITRKGT